MRERRPRCDGRSIRARRMRPARGTPTRAAAQHRTAPAHRAGPVPDATQAARTGHGCRPSRRATPRLEPPRQLRHTCGLRANSHGAVMFVRLPGGEFPSDYVPLLRWLIFTGVSAFGVALAWHFGLIRLMLAGDKTHISAVICALYVLASLHCLVATAAISRELNSGQRAFSLVRNGAARFRVVGDDVVIDGGAKDETRLPPGRVTGHIRNLVLK